MMKRLLLLSILALFATASAGTGSAYAQAGSGGEKVDIDPDQQIWLQLPTTTVPVQNGIHFVIVDVLITAAKHATYVCRIYPRLNEKIQFAFSANPPAADRQGVIQVQDYGRVLKPDFNQALQGDLVKRIKVFDGGRPKPPELDDAIMECQGSAAIMAAKSSLRDLLRRQR
ncbi:MAG: hypothetical protein RIC36_14500 [Rhodospirillales bacterium]